MIVQNCNSNNNNNNNSNNNNVKKKTKIYFIRTKKSIKDLYSLFF
jgi:hypothetical protein